MTQLNDELDMHFKTASSTCKITSSLDTRSKLMSIVLHHFSLFVIIEKINKLCTCVYSPAFIAARKKGNYMGNGNILRDFFLKMAHAFITLNVKILTVTKHL